MGGRWWRGSVLALALGCAACASEQVGAPCAPEQVPEGGFDGLESYVEIGSLQCETRTCLVHRFDGDLDSPDVHDSIYCSCRCDGEGDPAGFCDCPEGFVCQEVLGQGGPAIEGSYCVRR